MKIATIIVRVLMGLLFIYASANFFLKLAPEPETTGAFKAFQSGIVASAYIMPLAKVLELLCGLCFVSGKFVTLANIVILPVTINIFMIHLFLSPENLPMAIALILGNIFLIYRYWDNYKSVFTP
ncbi:DoxX family membrane protein [Flavobacterium sp.]|uniref:DoxX family membrane protein n=1 Tax=Flavobacterium sp. TaxID=239 RepID=UPI0026158486|nr:DoxX family membrane protein [Flavobacterium sp.]